MTRQDIIQNLNHDKNQTAAMDRWAAEILDLIRMDTDSSWSTPSISLLSFQAILKVSVKEGCYTMVNMALLNFWMFHSCCCFTFLDFSGSAVCRQYEVSHTFSTLSCQLSDEYIMTNIKSPSKRTAEVMMHTEVFLWGVFRCMVGMVHPEVMKSLM